MKNYSLSQKKENDIVAFDYSTLTDDERLSTLENEKKLDDLYQKYQPEIGKILFNQQKILANHNDGVFQQWYESKGFKRWKVYDYINKYQYVLRNSEDPKKIDIFENMPKTLQSEMSKPSANPEVNQAVYNGDIKTTKEYRELEKKLKQKDKQIENLSDVITELDNREPEVIEKIPYDYSSAKNENEKLKKELDSTKRNLKLSKMQFELLEKSTEEARNLEENINNLRKKEKGLADRVKATIEFNDLLREINTFFDKSMASLRFKPLVDELYDTEAVNKLSDVIGTVEFWTEEMRKILPNQNMRIIEGEIIDE